MTIHLEEMKQRLKAKEKELQENIDSLTEAYPTPVSTEEISEGPQEFEETAIDFIETQQERSILINDQNLLTEVQDALKRIEDGIYGLSVESGKPIPENRLQAIPWAARLIEEEEQLEQRYLSSEEAYGSDTF